MFYFKFIPSVHRLLSLNVTVKRIREITVAK